MILILCLLLSLRPALATSEDYGFRDLAQPDGTIFTVHKYIDDLGRFQTVQDAFVIQDPRDQYYYYAHIAEDGTVTPSRFKVVIDDGAEELHPVIQQSNRALREIRRKARDGEADLPWIDLWISYVYYVEFRQRDGTRFTVQRYMDEVGRYVRTERGYVVADGRDGYYYYAHIAEDGTVTPSRFKVGIDDEAEGLESVIQQSRSVVEELASRYHNGEDIESRIDLWSGYSGWVFIQGDEDPSLLCDEPIVPAGEDVLIPGRDYAAGSILLLLRPSEQAAFERLEEAAVLGRVVTGIVSFDSVSVVHHLEGIQQLGQASPYFLLEFSQDSDLAPIARGYCGLPYFEIVMLEIYAKIFGGPSDPTNLTGTSWGALKQGHRRRPRQP